MQNIFVFDIETVPDVDLGRKLHDLTDCNDHDVAESLFQLRRQASNGNDFLPHHFQRIVAISVVLRSNDRIRVWSLGEENSTEAELLERFFRGIEKYSPILVSWNGGGFDLPVIHYRSLLHGIQAPRYWETGDDDSNFRWNNYLNRFHTRHTDLMDVLAGYQTRANAPLDEISTMLGLPGKMGMHGSKVWEYFQQNKINDIRNYCETDVINTYLVYLRFLLISGKLTANDYDKECQIIRDHLNTADKDHFREFLQKWSR